MGLLPAAVPDVPEARLEIVPARLARKLAPLFGLAWAEGPFGVRTWVCDYNRLTLSEIARGAPLPPRSRVREMGAAVAGDWAMIDRVAVAGPGSELPNEIANATLNRFGPDTKAAVVLTGANLLLEPVTRAVATALGVLVAADGSPLPARLRVAAWAALLLEAFRSQPALVAAAVRARAIQRELLVEWHLPPAPSARALPLTRCEVGGTPDAAGPPGSRPRDLDLADATVPLDGADDLVDGLLRGLMDIGTRHSSSHLWLGERRPGELVVEALVSPTELVDRIARPYAEHPDPVLPRIPDAVELASLPVRDRRAVVLSLLTVLRQVRFDGEQRERTREQVVPLLDRVDALATAILGRDDPMALLTACRVADMTVHTLRHDVRHELGPSLERLTRETDRCIAAMRSGALDRGAAAEAVSSACVEVNVVRRTNAVRADAKLPAPADLDSWLRGSWAAFAAALEIDPRPPGTGPDPRAAAGHHLHNYAAYLATHPDDDGALHAAVELFETVVIPARDRYRAATGGSLPLRQSLQTASRATTRLAEREVLAGRPAAAARWAGTGLTWIRRALDEPETARLLDGSTEPAAHFCLLAVPALLVAVETGADGATDADRRRAGELLAVAQRWVHRVTGAEEERYVRHDELVALRRRLCALSRPTVGRRLQER